VKLARTRNINLLPPGPIFGPGRADPRFTDIYQLEDSAGSTYSGVSFTVNRRMSNELAFSANYTLSKTFDDASDFSEQPQNPFDFEADRAVSLQHQQQRLTFNALWELPIGDEGAGHTPKDDWVTRVFGHIEIAPILTVDSGRPVNPITGIDSNFSHAIPLSARPPGFGRNSFRTPMLANIDFRVLKYFPFGQTARLDLVGEAFNLLNHANVAQINPVFGTGPTPLTGFLQPLTGAGAIACPHTILPIHVVKLSRPIYDDECSRTGDPEVRCRQLISLGRVDDSIYSTTFLLADAHSPHQGSQPLISGLIPIDEPLDWHDRLARI
jgi:hypothetical protein